MTSQPVEGATEDHARMISFDGWVLRAPPRELLRDGRRVRLQDQPLQILEELVWNPGRLVTRERLIARLWPSGVVDFDGSLNTAVRKLRAALADDAETPRYIETVPRQGYRFIGHIDDDRVERPERVSAATSSRRARPADGSSERAELSSSRRRPRQLVWVAAAIVLAIATSSIVAVFAPSSLRDETSASAAADGRLRIAIVPFANLSPDPADAFFTDGLHEEVLSTLANRTANVDVISRTTMTTYRATPKPVSMIARELGVTHVLEGSVRREGKDVRLTLQLIDARNDTHLWSQTYDRELSSAMTLQSQVAAEVTAQLAAKLSSSAEQLPPTRNPEAYDLYLKAKLQAQGFAGRASIDTILEVEGRLDRALALDPAFAAAYVERSRIYIRKFDSSYDLSATNLDAARADLERARDLAGDLAQVLATESYYAHIVDMDLNRALALIEAPAVLASKDVTVLTGRAAILTAARRLDEALALYQEAGRLDPANPALFQSWHAVLWNARRPAEALQVMRAFDEPPSRHVVFTFSFTGRIDLLDERVIPVRGSIDPGSRLMARVNRLRWQGRLADAIRILEESDLDIMRQDSASPVAIPAIGRKPVAELHGWAMLLAGDGTAAGRDGRTILDFVAHEPVTQWNAWFLRFLAAEGELFIGNKQQAVAETRAALAATPRHLDTAIDRYSRATAAMIFAWAEADEEAAELLEGLSTEFPGLGPAEIILEPLYSVPLEHNARYQALEERLEAEMGANRKLFVSNFP